MKTKYFLIMALFLCKGIAAQTKAKTVTKKQEATVSKATEATSARMETVFLGDENKGQFSGGCELKSGTLKVGQIINITDDGGKSAQMKITRITDYRKKDDMGRSLDVTSASGPTNELFIELQTADGSKFPNPKGGFSLGVVTQKPVDTMAQVIAELNCALDGKNWKGATFYSSCSYFENGNPLMNEKGPVLILAFKSGQKPDDRQLTFSFKNYSGQIGSVDREKFEVLLSGSADGVAANSELLSNWENGLANTTKGKFLLEISKWEVQGDVIIVSGSFSGVLCSFNPLKKLSGIKTKKMEVTTGRFENIKVKYIKESYETQEKQLKRR